MAGGSNNRHQQAPTGRSVHTAVAGKVLGQAGEVLQLTQALFASASLSRLDLQLAVQRLSSGARRQGDRLTVAQSTAWHSTVLQGVARSSAGEATPGLALSCGGSCIRGVT